PTALPFRVRVLKNPTTQPHHFFIQPPPVGVVEEIFPLEITFSISFSFPFWRKDKITGDPNDGSIAYIGQVESKVTVIDFQKFARNLDPQAFKMVAEVNTSPFLTYLEKIGKTIPEKRLELLQEILLFDFSQEVLKKLTQISQGIDFKIYLVQKNRNEKPLSLSEQKIQLWKYLENYPWYKLEPQEIGKMIQENNQILEKITEYVKQEHTSSEAVKALRQEIQEYFAQYIQKNPQSYSRELWEYSIEKGLSMSHPPSPDDIRALTYSYVHDRLHILEDLLRSEDYQKNLLERYGITIAETTVKIGEDLSSRYSELLP
ncbi:MAG: hypothetical protein ACUVRN_10080, partial [Candidatus Caldatribacteriaceae bacterium]